ncbi:MAG: GNAT family N-acetyltransferase [Candidatus Latescibacteria bacterium]|nr:GNAT family N-acetyltransferase [Candidatus Latescibacterota bacterium]
MRPIETQRLIVRPFSMADAEDTHRLIYADPRIKWGARQVDLKGVKERIRYHIDRSQQGNFFTWAVQRKEDGQFIGMMPLECELADYIVFEHAPDDPYYSIEVELGYVLGRDFWDQGYCTEAARALVDYAFNTCKLRRLVSSTSWENARSRRVMVKLGCRFERNLHPDFPNRVLGILENNLA